MSISQPPAESQTSGRSADDIDGLLREFFQSALPRPWSAFQRPARETLPLTRSTSWKRRFRSSLALAASLAILALSLGLLSGKFTDRTAPTTPADPPIGTNDPPYKETGPRHGSIQPEKK